MADLLTATGGQLFPESQQILIARFDCQESAVSAARRLQRALQAFTEFPETAGLAASIAIYGPEDHRRSGAALGLSDWLWSDSGPGQILVSGSVHKTLQFTPGLGFRGVSAVSLRPDATYQELLWTDSETLATWQNRQRAATRDLPIVDPHRQPEVGTAYAEKRDAVSFANPAAVCQEDVSQTSIDGSRRKNRVWFAAGAVCLALVGAIGTVVHLSAKKTHGTPQPPSKNQTIAQQTPQSDKPPGAGNALEKQQETSPKETESSPGHARIPPTGPKAQGETEVPVKEYEGFTSKQVPQLLRKAEEDAGAGKYDDAKREYEIVLKLQPGNSAAQGGLRKLGMKTGAQR